VGRLPIAGPILFFVWKYLVRGEGRTITIRGGQLKGMRVRRCIRVTDRYPGLEEGNHEDEFEVAIIRELHAGATFFDVGAHAGLFSLLAFTVIGPSGTIVAFEPHPGNAREVRAQLHLNAITNGTVVEAAVSDRVGKSVLLDLGDSSMFRLVDVRDGAKFGGTVSVRTTTLDIEAEAVGVPDAIKLDIEGAEILALKGANRLLQSRKPKLFVEVHRSDIAADLYSMLLPLGYVLYQTNGAPITDETWHRFIIAK